MWKRLALCVAVVLAQLAGAGCGSGNAQGRKAIAGTVRLDGAPLASGSIEFAPVAAGGVQTGALIEGGKFSIPREQGLPVGEYRVSIVDSPQAPPLPPGHMPGDPLPPAPKPRIPAAWNTKSQHKVTVPESGPSTFDFDISSKN